MEVAEFQSNLEFQSNPKQSLEINYKLKKGIDSKLEPNTEHNAKNIILSINCVMASEGILLTSYSLSWFIPTFKLHGNQILLEYYRIHYLVILSC